jgi:hypothetical protein
MSANAELLVKGETLQNTLISRATGKGADDDPYISLRRELIDYRNVNEKLPTFVKSCRDLDQFFDFIKGRFAHYPERRNFIWQEFQPLLEALERGKIYPSDESVSEILLNFDVEHVHKIWVKALDRRSDDPDGAITSARSLLETVCKRILDEAGESYDDGIELPKLYTLTAKQLNLAPSQHTEQIFKQILGNCQAIVESLSAIRNRLGDAHGKGQKMGKPAPRHAELAVNLAGTMATFLVATWNARGKTPT